MIRWGYLALLAALSVGGVGCGEIEDESWPESGARRPRDSGVVRDGRDGSSNLGRLDARDGPADGRKRPDAGDAGDIDATPDSTLTDAASESAQPFADANDLIEPDGSICHGVDPATLLGAPIIPPYAAAGLDLFGGPLGNGSEGWNPNDASTFQYNSSQEGNQPCKISDVTTWICDPGVRTYVGETTIDGGMYENEAIPFDFFPFGGFALYYTRGLGTVNAIQIQAWGGLLGDERIYKGTIEATAPDGTHYSIGLARPIMKTPPRGVAAPLVFPTEAANVGAVSTETKDVVNEIYVALVAQFLASEMIPPDCFEADACSVLDVPGDVTTSGTGPAKAGEILLVYPALHLELGVRVLPGSREFQPGNSVAEVDLFAAEPSLTQD